MKQIYYNATFYTQNPEQPTADCLVVEDQRIAWIGSYDALPAEHMGAQENDLNGMYAFPGYVDTYSTLAIDAYMKECAADGTSKSDIAEWTKDAWACLLDHGVTKLVIANKTTAAPFLSATKAQEIPESLVLFPEEFHSEFGEDLYEDYYENVADSPLTSGLLFRPVVDDSDSVQEAIDHLTTLPAAALHSDQCAGTLAVGQFADFSVFETNPLEKDLGTFPWIHAMLVVSQGEEVYDAFHQAMDELYDLLSMQTF